MIYFLYNMSIDIMEFNRIYMCLLVIILMTDTMKKIKYYVFSTLQDDLFLFIYFFLRFRQQCSLACGT